MPTRPPAIKKRQFSRVPPSLWSSERRGRGASCHNTLKKQRTHTHAHTQQADEHRAQSTQIRAWTVCVWSGVHMSMYQRRKKKVLPYKSKISEPNTSIQCCPPIVQQSNADPPLSLWDSPSWRVNMCGLWIRLVDKSRASSHNAHPRFRNARPMKPPFHLHMALQCTSVLSASSSH